MAEGCWTFQYPTTDGRLPEGCRPGCKSISGVGSGRIVEPTDALITEEQQWVSSKVKRERDDESCHAETRYSHSQMNVCMGSHLAGSREQRGSSRSGSDD